MVVVEKEHFMDDFFHQVSRVESRSLSSPALCRRLRLSETTSVCFALGDISTFGGAQRLLQGSGHCFSCTGALNGIFEQRPAKCSGCAQGLLWPELFPV